MLTRTQENKRSFSSEFTAGKNICISFGGHELGLIDDLDFLAHLECVNRSQWIRRKIREEKMKLQDHNLDWNNLFEVKS